jgi:uncharacterized protein YndB with AHSA1/START domain
MAVQMDKAQITLPSDREVAVTRTFDAPRALVFEAYTQPELVKRWMLGPPGWSIPVCEMDVRPGGKFRWRWRSEEDGKEFGFHGEFREVAAPSKIVHTESFDPGDIGGTMGDEPALITTTFTERDGRTTMKALMDFGSKKSRDEAMATGMTDGMEQSYQLLDAVLAERNG